MDISTRYTYFTGILMYKFTSGLLPPSLINDFHFVKNIHPYPTRSSCSNNIALPQVKTEFFKRTISYTGPALWNSLPVDLRNSTSVDVFKRNFKCFLLSQLNCHVLYLLYTVLLLFISVFFPPL